MSKRTAAGRSAAAAAEGRDDQSGSGAPPTCILNIADDYYHDAVQDLMKNKTCNWFHYAPSNLPAYRLTSGVSISDDARCAIRNMYNKTPNSGDRALALVGGSLVDEVDMGEGKSVYFACALENCILGDTMVHVSFVAFLPAGADVNDIDNIVVFVGKKRVSIIHDPKAEGVTVERCTAPFGKVDTFYDMMCDQDYSEHSVQDAFSKFLDGYKSLNQ